MKSSTPHSNAPFSRAAANTVSRSVKFTLAAKLPAQHTLASGNIPLAQAVQMKSYNNGKRTYDTETFMANRERAKSVVGVPTIRSTEGRGAAPKALSLFDPTTAKFDTDLPGFDGGHVLGLELGGIDTSYNVVPMFPKFNRDVWRNVEKELISAALFPYSGRNLSVTITANYANGLSRIPNSMRAEAFADEQKKDRKGNVIKTSRKKVYDKTLSQPGDIQETPQASVEEQKLLSGGDKTVKNSLASNGKDDPYSTAILKTGHLPEPQMREYPYYTSMRIYEYLDVLAFANKLSVFNTFSSNREFTGDQRRLILQTNMLRNGGKLKSDDPEDPQQNLSEKGAANFPEVDHIVPKSRGGGNFYSNARLVSWQLNNKEDRVKSLTSLFPIKTLAYPVIYSKVTPEDASFVVRKWMAENKKTSFKADEVRAFVNLHYLFFTKTKKEAIVTIGLNELVKNHTLTLSGNTYTEV